MHSSRHHLRSPSLAAVVIATWTAQCLAGVAGRAKRDESGQETIVVGLAVALLGVVIAVALWGSIKAAGGALIQKVCSELSVTC